MKTRFAACAAVVLFASTLLTDAAAPPPSPTDALGDPLPTGAFARLGTARLRHAGAVVGLAVTGNDIVSLGADGWVHRWDPKTGKHLRSVAAVDPGGGVPSVSAALSADGSTILLHTRDEGAAGKVGHVVEARETATGRVRYRHVGATIGEPSEVIPAPDGRTFVAVKDKAIVGYDGATGRERCRIAVGIVSASVFAVSPDGKRLAVPDFGPVTLYDLETGKETGSIDDERSRRTVRFSGDGKSLVAAERAGGVGVYDTASGKRLRRFTLEGVKWADAPALAVSADGRRVAVGDEITGVALLADIASGKVTAKLSGLHGVGRLAFSPEGSRLVAGCGGYRLHVHRADQRRVQDGDEWRVRVFDADSGKELSPVGDPPRAAGRMALSADGRYLATTGLVDHDWALAPHRVEVWSVADRKHLRSFGADTGPTCIAFSPSGELAVGGAGGVVRLYDVASGTERRRLTPPVNSAARRRDAVLSVAFTPDGTSVLVGTPGLVRVMRATDGRLLHRLACATELGDALAVSRDGKLVAAGTAHRLSQDFYVWDLATGENVRRIDNERSGPSAFGRGGVLFWAGSVFGDYAIVEMNPRTGVRQLYEETRATRRLDQFHSVAVSPDGKTLALGGQHGLELWDTATRTRVRRMTGPFGGGIDVAFTPDGKTLAASHFDGTVIMWGVRPYP